MPRSIVRNAQTTEIESLPANLYDWTSGFVEIPRTREILSSRGFDPEGCFVAEDKGSVIGCVAVTSLPRKNWLVIRYLAAKHAQSKVFAVEKLLSRALEYVETKKPKFFRATTPSMQPYVDVYKSFGFKPIRRDFRISWDLRENELDLTKKTLEIKEVDEKTADEAGRILVQAISPYWDWRTEEEGGEDAVVEGFHRGLKKGEQWLTATLGKEIIGLTGIHPDYYGPREGRFRGAFVVPKHRGKGIGRAVMNEGSNWARKLGQTKMTVYTFSYIESLAPGALLYLKSGGKIESEYLQLQRMT